MDNQQHTLTAVAQDEDTLKINHNNFEEILIKEEPLDKNPQYQEFYENIFQYIKKEECATYNDNQIDKECDNIITTNNDICKTENTVSNSSCCIKCNKTLTRANLNNYPVCEPDCEKLDGDNINENVVGCSKTKGSVREIYKLETFDPDDPNNNIDRWLAKLDQLGTTYGWSDSERSYIMQMKLKGAARQLFIRQNSYDLSWPQWKTTMTQAFRYNYAAMLRELLARVKIPEETMTSYFRSKLALCDSCQISGEKAVTLLIDGLPAEIQARAFAAHCKTPQELYSTFLADLGEYRGEFVADSTQNKRQSEPEPSNKTTKLRKIMPKSDTEQEPSRYESHVTTTCPTFVVSAQAYQPPVYCILQNKPILYYTHNNPGSTFGEISSLVGNEWRSLPPGEKQASEEKAQKYNEENAAMARNETEPCPIPEPTQQVAPLPDKKNGKPKGKRCAMKDCKNFYIVGGMSFFGFPTDPERAKLWIEACGRPDLVSKEPQALQKYRVCSSHFEEKMFLNDLKNRLQPHAIPVSQFRNKANPDTTPEQTYEIPAYSGEENATTPSTSSSSFTCTATSPIKSPTSTLKTQTSTAYT